MKLFVSAILAALALSSRAEAATPPEATQPAPEPAARAGYNLRTFHTEAFSGETVDLRQTYRSGYNWYFANFFGHQVEASSITIKPDGTAALLEIGNYNAAIASIGQTARPPYFVGTAFGCGGYITAEIAYDPDTIDPKVGWPAWWAMSSEHMLGKGGDQWPGQPKGYTHFIEVDILEAVLPASDLYAALLHDWSGTYRVTCPPQFCDIHSMPATVSTGKPPNWRQFHAVGFLWVPATDTSPGTVEFFFEGKSVGTRSWAKFDGQVPPVLSGASWKFGVIDKQHLTLLLGSASSPLNVKSVSVWQGKDACNITN